MNVEDSLRLELEAEKHNHRKDNEYLVGEIERLRKEGGEVSGSGGTVAGNPVVVERPHVADPPQLVVAIAADLDWIASVLGMLATDEGRARASSLGEYVSLPTLVRKAQGKVKQIRLGVFDLSERLRDEEVRADQWKDDALRMMSPGSEDVRVIS